MSMPNGVGPCRQADAVVAAGEVVGAIGDAPDDLPERERDHDEAQARRAQRQHAEQAGQAVENSERRIAALS